jgi:hypothetical protein
MRDVLLYDLGPEYDVSKGFGCGKGAGNGTYKRIAFYTET